MTADYGNSEFWGRHQTYPELAALRKWLLFPVPFLGHGSGLGVKQTSYQLKTEFHRTGLQGLGFHF